MRAISKTDKSLDQPLGRYQLIALLGQGGMADVYLACTQGPGGFQKLLVVKLARFTGDPMLSRMFLDEARLAAQLSHPNVVQTFEVGEEGSRHFMVMEYLDGATLSRLRQRASSSGGVPLRLAVQLLSQVLEGLEYAHAARGIDGAPLKVVHRDLTPSNIVITVQGVAKILDFGIAKAADSYSFTQAGRYSGKLTYMPPEQLRAERVDERADIFSVGVILAESAMGMRYWGSATEPMVASRLIAGDLPSFEGSGVDPELRRICERALAPDRDHRYPNAAAFKDDLNRYLATIGGPVPREEIAEFVCAMIGEDRAKLQAIVDSQLQGSRLSFSTSELALPELPRIEATPALRSAQQPAVAARSESSLLLAAPPPPRLRAESTLGVDSVDVELISEQPTEHATPMSSALPQHPTPSHLPPLSYVSPPLPVATVSPKRRAFLLAGIGGGAALAAVAAFLLVRSGTGEREPTAPAGADVGAPVSTAAAALPTAPTAPAPAAVRLEIVVSPPEAVVALDGRLLGTNPYVGAHPRDAQIHALTVTADGYQTHTQTFVLDRDLMLQLHLQPAKETEVASSAPLPSRSMRGSARRGGRELSRDPSPAPSSASTPTTSPSQVAAESAAEKADRATDRATDKPSDKSTGSREGKRSLDGDVFDKSTKPNKRALDSDVFEDAGGKKPSIDRDTPWKK